MRVLLWLALLLVLPACDGGAPDDGVALTCERIGTRTDGQFRARVVDPFGERPFTPGCTRATQADGRTVVRALVLSGPLIEGDIVLTAIGTATGVYSVAAGQASARYAVAGQTYEATEGSVVLTLVTEATVAGTFDFVARDGVRVTSGEFTLPR